MISASRAGTFARKSSSSLTILLYASKAARNISFRSATPTLMSRSFSNNRLLPADNSVLPSMIWASLKLAVDTLVRQPMSKRLAMNLSNICVECELIVSIRYLSCVKLTDIPRQSYVPPVRFQRQIGHSVTESRNLGVSRPTSITSGRSPGGQSTFYPKVNIPVSPQPDGAAQDQVTDSRSSPVTPTKAETTTASIPGLTQKPLADVEHAHPDDISGAGISKHD